MTTETQTVTHKGRVTEAKEVLTPAQKAQQEAERQARVDRRAKIIAAIGALGLGVIGVGTLGFGLWAGWFVAGVIATKLGLLGFGWHLLSFCTVGGFITLPFAAVWRMCMRGTATLIGIAAS
jgi:fatty acid desaturase